MAGGKGDHIRAGFRPFGTQLLPRRLLVVVRQVAQEQKSQHVVAEIVRVHGTAQFVGDGPEHPAQFFLLLFGHVISSWLAASR